MKISKYNANGNDFAVFHAFIGKDRSELARAVCDRVGGVGADGLIVLLPNGRNSVKWEFYNSDGSYAAMCGNGSRAAFLYAYDNGLISQSATLLSGAGLISGSIGSEKFCFKNGKFCENSSENLNGEDEIFALNARSVEVALTSPKKLSESFEESGFTWHFYDTGVPHLVAFTDDLAKFDVDLARAMRQKYDANVNFALITSRGSKNFSGANLRVRTYERGVENETLACGTGMAACFYAAYELGLAADTIAVQPKSGEILGLRLDVGKIFFKGVVQHVFDVNLS